MATPLEMWVRVCAARKLRPYCVLRRFGGRETGEFSTGNAAELDSVASRRIPTVTCTAAAPMTLPAPSTDLHPCTPDKDDVGPTNNWMDPAAAKFKISALLDERCANTLYVVPIMGPADSPISKAGVEITDSPYVVANMRIMARMGRSLPIASATRATLCPDLFAR